jgi:hypothetical protein
MLLVRIILVNIIMIDIHASMRDRKQSDGNVRPDWMWLYNLASQKGLTIGLKDVAALKAATKL